MTTCSKLERIELLYQGWIVCGNLALTFDLDVCLSILRESFQNFERSLISFSLVQRCEKTFTFSLWRIVFDSTAIYLFFHISTTTSPHLQSPLHQRPATHTRDKRHDHKRNENFFVDQSIF